MPSRKNKRFAKKKGKASLKKTFSKKRIVGGFNDGAFALSIGNNQNGVAPAPTGDVKNEENNLPVAQAQAQPTAAQAATGQENTSLWSSFIPSPSVASQNNATSNSSSWSSYLPGATASTSSAAPPAAPQTRDSPEVVNMLANTGELERLKAMVERHPEFKDGVTGFFPIPAITRAFDGIKENGNDIDDPQNSKRADIILYLISKGADTSSITATSASPKVMTYIINNMPDDVPDDAQEKIKKISFELSKLSVVAKPIPEGKKKKYGAILSRILSNFTDESAKELLISIAKDGTVGDLIDFIEMINNKQKAINDFINYQQGEVKLTPLMVACINNNTDIVKKMLSTENISPTINDTILKHTILLNKDSSSNTFLHHAAQNAGLIDIIAGCLQNIKEKDIEHIDDLKTELAKAKNSKGETVFSIVCNMEPTQSDLIKKLDDTKLITEKDDIHNPGFKILEQKFNDLKTLIEHPDYTTNNTTAVISSNKKNYTEYLTLFKNIGYSLFNVRFADNTGFEQIYLQRWDNILKPNDKNYTYKSDKCKKYSVSSCVPTDVEYKGAFDALLEKIKNINNSLGGIYIVTYKSVCDAIQKKYGIFDTINKNPQFKGVDIKYFVNNSDNNTTVKYEEEYDEIRKPLDDYILTKFEEELLRTVDKDNLNRNTPGYKVKSKYCKELHFLAK